MKKQQVTKTQYSESCTYCGRLLKGTSESQLLYNLGVHIQQKHKKLPFEKSSKKMLKIIKDEIDPIGTRKRLK